MCFTVNDSKPKTSTEEHWITSAYMLKAGLTGSPEVHPRPTLEQSILGLAEDQMYDLPRAAMKNDSPGKTSSKGLGGNQYSSRACYV